MSRDDTSKRVIVVKATAKDAEGADYPLQPVRQFMLCMLGKLPKVVQTFQGYDAAMCYAKAEGYELTAAPKEPELWPDLSQQVANVEEVVAIIGDLMIIQIVAYGPFGVLAKRFQPKYPFWIFRVGKDLLLSAHSTEGEAWAEVKSAERRHRQELKELRDFKKSHQNPLGNPFR
jgi:hypothetical protein